MEKISNTWWKIQNEAPKREVYILDLQMHTFVGIFEHVTANLLTLFSLHL